MEENFDFPTGELEIFIPQGRKYTLLEIINLRYENNPRLDSPFAKSNFTLFACIMIIYKFVFYNL